MNHQPKRPSLLDTDLLDRLTQAEVVCKDCGMKYGRYSVGCSSTWIGRCNVCGETKGVTEVRDYGYLQKGIHEVMAGKKSEPEHDLTLTETEITILNDILEDVTDQVPSESKDDFLRLKIKVNELYEDNCVKYSISPLFKAYLDAGGEPGDDRSWNLYRSAYEAGKKSSQQSEKINAVT